jgi:prepilin-type processing-associated H-X9-DG protein
MKLPEKIRAFSLTNILIATGIFGTLTALLLPNYQRSLDKAREVQCISNLRTIGPAILSFAAERNGYLWTREEIGHSSFRAADDPLGLPQLLKDYLPDQRVWLCPAGRPGLREHANNYAWSRAANITGKPLVAVTRPSSTVLVWDNHTMTLPSVYNVPEVATTGGPRVAPAHFRRFPHGSGKKLGWLYLDGHVQIR